MRGSGDNVSHLVDGRWMKPPQSSLRSIVLFLTIFFIPETLKRALEPRKQLWKLLAL